MNESPIKWSLEELQIKLPKQLTIGAFTENKAVLNGETVKICCSISQWRFNISKNPLMTRCSIWCRLLNSFQNFGNCTSSLKKMDSGNAITNCYMQCKNFQILIRSPLLLKFLHLLSKFYGYIFNSLREKWI